jgi:hypothetical protein
MSLYAVVVLAVFVVNAVGNSSYGASPTDRGCCVFWENANRLKFNSAEEQTRSECARLAKDVAESSRHHDFFQNRSCSQAVRCRDAACTNLSSEQVKTID